MKLCYVGNLESIHTVRWVRYFASEGHEVHLLTPSDVSSALIEGAYVHVFRRIRTRIHMLDLVLNVLLMIPMVLKFKALFKRLAPDIVHVHYINEAAVYAVMTRVRPIVVTPWGSDVLIAPRRSVLRRLAVRLVLRRARLITCDADHLREELIRLGADPSKVLLIYFGTDTERFSPVHRDEALRRRLGLDGATAVVSSRSLEPIYDVGSLIKAIPLVLKRTLKVKFLIAGSGSGASRLRAIAESLRVEGAVCFLGQLSEHDMARYLASSDIYVSTALSDGGLAASTAEAMACGLPVIVTDGGDNRLWVSDGVNGYIVPPRDPQALAGKIIELVQDIEARERFGRKNRRIIEERNNWSREMARMGRLYETLIGRGSATADQAT